MNDNTWVFLPGVYTQEKSNLVTLRFRSHLRSAHGYTIIADLWPLSTPHIPARTKELSHCQIPKYHPPSPSSISRHCSSYVPTFHRLLTTCDTCDSSFSSGSLFYTPRTLAHQHLNICPSIVSMQINYLHCNDIGCHCCRSPRCPICVVDCHPLSSVTTLSPQHHCITSTNRL